MSRKNQLLTFSEFKLPTRHFLAKISVWKITSAHEQEPQTSCRADLEAGKQMGAAPSPAFLASKETERWDEERIAAIKFATEASEAGKRPDRNTRLFYFTFNVSSTRRSEKGTKETTGCLLLTAAVSSLRCVASVYHWAVILYTPCGKNVTQRFQRHNAAKGSDN